MEKLDGKSMDLTQNNIENLKNLFPEAFCEDKIDFDKLRLLLGDNVEDNNQRYELRWSGKYDTIKNSQAPSTGTLRPCKEESKNFDTTKNLYIEGDNLEVLKLLQKSYFGKIKMIYIDPPYNTGKDFVYKDDFTDSIENYKEITNQKFSSNAETNGRYHTDWLNMIYPRLKLARNLLTDDGVIFISIDDNEVHNLRKVCDEIFGENNFISQITIVGNPRGRDYGGIALMHDYILVYQKSKNTSINLVQDIGKEFKLFDNISGFELRELRNRNVKFNKDNRPNLYYPFYINEKVFDENGLFDISLEKREGWYELFPLESQGIKTVWRWGKLKSEDNLNINIKAKQMKNGGYQIVEKYREEKVMARSVWWDKDTNTEKGTLLIKQLFEGKYFDYPKPLEMLKKICEMGTNTNDIILDFFSGSSTTAHAVMKLNSEDNGNRKFIMVQIPELTDEKSEAYKAGYKNICEIGKERIRRAGEQILSSCENKDLDVGFKVFKLDDTNIKTWNPDFDKLEGHLHEMTDIIKKDRTKLDVLYEVILKMGLDLTYEISEIKVCDKVIYNVGCGAVLVCLEDNITSDLVDEIIKNKSEFMDTKVVFLESGFKMSSVRINAIKNLNNAGILDIRSI